MFKDNPFMKIFQTPAEPEYEGEHITLPPDFAEAEVEQMLNAKEAFCRARFREETFLSLCSGGMIGIHNLPDTVFNWIDGMYEEMEKRNG